MVLLIWGFLLFGWLNASLDNLRGFTDIIALFYAKEAGLANIGLDTTLRNSFMIDFTIANGNVALTGGRLPFDLGTDGTTLTYRSGAIQNAQETRNILNVMGLNDGTPAMTSFHENELLDRTKWLGMQFDTTNGVRFDVAGIHPRAASYDDVWREMGIDAHALPNGPGRQNLEIALKHAEQTRLAHLIDMQNFKPTLLKTRADIDTDAAAKPRKTFKVDGGPLKSINAGTETAYKLALMRNERDITYKNIAYTFSGPLDATINKALVANHYPIWKDDAVSGLSNKNLLRNLKTHANSAFVINNSHRLLNGLPEFADLRSYLTSKTPHIIIDGCSN